MKDAEKTFIFEQMPVPRAIAKLAVPTVFSSLVMVLYNLADTWFVGFLNDPVQNASVALAAPVLLSFYAVNNLFGVGASSAMGRALGRKNIDSAKRCSAFGFWAAFVCALLLSLFFTVFKSPLFGVLGVTEENSAATGGYLFWTVSLGAVPSILNVVMAFLVRTEGAAMHASIGTMSGCALNMILDPIFIQPWGLGMGAAGAGCATFISNCAACLYFFILLYYRRKNTYVCLDPKMAKPHKVIAGQVCSVGVPAAVQNLLNVIGMTVLNNYMAAYGTTAVAVIGIANKANMFLMQITFGMTQCILPFVSYNYGSRNYKRAKAAILFTGKVSTAFLTCFVLILFIFSDQVIYAFIRNETVIAYGARFLRVICFTAPFMCVDFLGVSVYQAFGKGMLSLVAAIMRKVVLEIPFLILFDKIYPMYGLTFAQPAAEVIMSVIAFCILYFMFKKLLNVPGKEQKNLAILPK